MLMLCRSDDPSEIDLDMLDANLSDSFVSGVFGGVGIVRGQIPEPDPLGCMC